MVWCLRRDECKPDTIPCAQIISPCRKYIAIPSGNQSPESMCNSLAPNEHFVKRSEFYCSEGPNVDPESYNENERVNLRDSCTMPCASKNRMTFY
ncbi:hypothetical protein K474DRAFT_1655192, partial [Panus rudis PR-1116 ss-1]